MTARERRILRAIRDHGQISRAALIQETGLSGVAVFRATTELAAAGLLEIGATVTSGRGQPSNSVHLNPSAVTVLGLSVMNDHAEAVLLDFTGAPIATAGVGTLGMKRNDVARNVDKFLDRALAANNLSRATVIGAGIAIAGFFVDPNSAVNPAAELDDWALIDLANTMSILLQLPVRIENIANAAAVGEKLLGVGRDLTNFVYLNFSQGFGAGLVIDGKLARGCYGNAGEVGGLLSIAGLPSPSLTSLRHELAAHGLRFENVIEMAQLFDPTWPGVASWLEAHAPSVSFLVNALRYTVDCEAIIFGGLLPPPLADELSARVRPYDEVVPPRRDVGWKWPQLLRASITAHSASIGVAAEWLARDYFD
ncbi:transcriptional repressor sugar kinase [Gluconobacter frateurii M-2]|nr:transcriptional repressor sugar kinase [Gluconobacter frateurii M-2]